MKLGLRRKSRDDGRYGMELDQQSCPEYDCVPVRVGLRTYYIPVDSGGYVPTWAIVSRFHECCDADERRADRMDGDERILPPRLTPKEIGEWWANPRVCDIAGIDTAESEFYDVSCIDDPIMQEIQSRIAVISSSRSEADRIRKEIAKAFDYSELDEMTSGNSIIIQTVPDGGDAYGVYMRKQSGMPTPILIYEVGASPGTIVHELVHHLRTMPSRRYAGNAATTFPMKGDGTIDLTAITHMSHRDVDMMQAVEENETVSETILRMNKDFKPSGYYEDVHNGRTIEQNFRQDQKILKGSDINRRIKGKQAVKRINLESDRTNIAKANIISRVPAKVAAKKEFMKKKKD